MPVRIFVSMLQMLAMLVLLAGVIGEILALHVLLRQHSGNITDNIIFYSTTFLIVLLGITLAARVPGVFIVDQQGISLNLEDEEELLWSGRCARLVFRPFPWLWGKLFLTNQRLVWMTTQENGLYAAPTIEIDLERTVEISNDSRLPGWTKYLFSNSIPPFPPYGQFFDMTVENGKMYHLCASVAEEEFERLIETMIQLSTENGSIEPTEPSGLGWPIDPMTS